MDYLDEAAVEIAVDSDRDIGVFFFAEKMPGVQVAQAMCRSMPDFGQANEVFLLVKNAAGAVTAVAVAVKALRVLLRKHPDVAKRVSLRVRAGVSVKRESLSELWELGLSVDYTQEPTETFGAGPRTPSRPDGDGDK